MNEVGLTRERAERGCAAMPHRQRFKASVWSTEVDGRRFVVKDYGATHWLYRRTLARIELRRERRAYRRLRGLPFVAHCFGFLDRDALLLEAVDARTLTAMPPAELQPGLFLCLYRAIAVMHEHGILHNDLRHRTNILVTRRGDVRIVDFSSSLDLGRGGLRRRLLSWLRFLDRSAAIKWWLRYFPDHVPDGEREWYRGYLRVRRLWPVGNPALRREARVVQRAE